MMSFKLTAILLTAILLTSCSALGPEPAATPTVTSSPVPTLTSTATSLPTATTTTTTTATLVPSVTATATSVPASDTPTPDVLSLPSGTPVAEWNGMPVMPGALAGSGDDNIYSFTIKSKRSGIQTYYTGVMAQRGWDLLVTGQNDKQTVILIFQKGTDTASISIFVTADANIYLVMLVH